MNVQIDELEATCSHLREQQEVAGEGYAMCAQQLATAQAEVCIMTRLQVL